MVLPLYADRKRCFCKTDTESGTTYTKMYKRVPEFHGSTAIFAIDFQNDGELVGGCIAGGRHYLHINAKGGRRTLSIYSLL
ncbi:MAG: hypothetical protein HUJ74_02055 [Lachnospiraceae bacterium]|nr:hypothetical protein [Lachnospiraceae bacterium]